MYVQESKKNKKIFVNLCCNYMFRNNMWGHVTF